MWEPLDHFLQRYKWYQNTTSRLKQLIVGPFCACFAWVKSDSCCSKGANRISQRHTLVAVPCVAGAETRCRNDTWPLLLPPAALACRNYPIDIVPHSKAYQKPPRIWAQHATTFGRVWASNGALSSARGHQLHPCLLWRYETCSGRVARLYHCPPGQAHHHHFHSLVDTRCGAVCKSHVPTRLSCRRR